MEKQKTTKFSIKEPLLFLLVIFCFVCVPAFITTYSSYIYFQINEEKIVNNLKTYSQHIANELRRNIKAVKYFCRIFHEYNLNELKVPNSNIDNCINYCKELKTKYGDKINFVVLTNDGEIKYNSCPNIYNHPSKTWYEAYHYVKYYYSASPELLGNGETGNEEALKEIFGPLTLSRTFRSLCNESVYNLVLGGYSEKYLPGGVYTFKWGGFFVFISKELLNDITHLKNIIKEYSSDNNIIVGLYNPQNQKDSIWTINNLSNKQELERVLNDSEIQVKNFIDTTNHYVCKQSLTDNYRLFTFSKKKNTKLELFLKCISVFFIYCLLSGYIINYFINTILLKKPGKASIRLKIAFLFIFASAIPLLLFALVSYEYETQKRETLIKEARVWSIENLLSIEQRYQTYLKTIANDLNNYIAEWGKGLKNKKLNNEYAKILGKKLFSHYIHNYYILSSSTPYIATSEGFFKYEGNLDNLKFDLSSGEYNYDQANMKPGELEEFVKNKKQKYYKSVIVVLKKILSDLYDYKIPEAVLSKLEIVTESFLDRPLLELTYIFIDIENDGIIKELGYGKKIYMHFFKLLSLHDKAFNDYCITTSWQPDVIQEKFIEDISVKVNRNSQNFKFIAFQKYERFFIPKYYEENSQLETFAKRVGDKPTEELEIINLNGEDYIAVGVLGKNIDKFSFVGLYPMKNIEIEITNQKSLLLSLGLLSLLLSIGLAQLLSKSFINPLLILQDGALAIENRNFKYRLSGLATDEFGEVGKVFNHVMVGLEDLELARIVQESMFPKPEFSQGKFSIYGKSVTMIDVGGDYLDFFKVDDNSFAVLLGDVAGHGLGAAVIMAMAKSAILVAENLHSPAAVLNHLHKMILATKSAKQRKIMTFQYLYINSETGENLYSNAGACSPWLIRHSDNSVHEMKMPGPVLGAFKKTVYKETPLDIKPGDAIVFYTDGIVECKDKNGEMLGYDRLKTLLLNCWNKNPEKYYNNIYNAYLDYVGKDAEAGDDLTFVILMYNNS